MWGGILKKLVIFRGKENLDGCKLFRNNNKMFLICGDYLRIIHSIIELWNDGINPKSYLSEIARKTGKDKSWVYEIVNKLLKQGIITKNIRDGYKKKAMYMISKNLDETDVSQKFEVKDYRLFDILFLFSMILVDYIVISRNDMTLLLIWSILIPIVELILHFK